MATDPENIYAQRAAERGQPQPTAPTAAIRPIIGTTTPEERARQAEEEARARRGEARAETGLSLQIESAERGEREYTQRLIGDYRQQFLGMPEVRDFREVANSARQIIALAEGARTEEDERAMSDMALVFSFMKALDPGSTVREGEYASTRNAAGIPDRIRTAYNNLISGEGLSPTQRAEMGRVARTLYNQRLVGYNEMAEIYGGLIADAGGDPARQGVITYDPYDLPSAMEQPQEEGAARVSGTGDFMTAEDRELQGRLRSAYNAGATLEELQAISAEYNRTLPISTQEALDAGRREGRDIRVLPSGRRTVAEETLGGVAESPVGAYFVGATNALLSGGMDEIGNALGMDAETIQLSKEQLRKDYPASSFAGEVSGQMLQSIPVMRGGQALGLGTRGLGALEVVQGAAYGAGEAPEGERLTGAAFGAGGAVVGQQVAQRLIEPGIQAIIQRISRDTGAPREVIEQLVEESFGGGAARQAEVPPAGGAVPEMPPSPPAGAAPPPAAAAAPEVPAPSPTPPRAPSVAEQQGISEEMVALARRAAGRGPGSSAARAELRAAVEADPALIQQAETLGLELPSDVFSANEQLKNLIGLARSQPGSAAEAGWQQTVANSAQQVEQSLTEMGASRDLAGLSDEVFTRLNNNMESLQRQGDELREAVNANLNMQSRVEATNLQDALAQTINDLGGIEEAMQAMTSQERRLLQALGVGETPKQPTYAYLDRLRREIGDALNKGTGPWADTERVTLQRYYNALAEDRIAHVARELGQDAADDLAASNQIFQAMYAARDEMTNLFGRDLDKGIGAQIRSVIAQGAGGDTTNLRRLMAVIPEDMRADVAFSGILANARSRGAEGAFSFANFRNTYRAIRENASVYRELARNMSESQRNFLDNLYGVSQGIADAQRRIISTGRARGGPAEEINAQSLTQKIVEQATRRGVGAGTGMLGGTLLGDVTMGIPAAVALEAGLAYLGRGGASNLDRVSEVIGSAAYRDLVNEAGRGGNMTRAINRLANSRPFGLFARGLGLNTQDARRAWIRSALTTGTVSNMGGGQEQTGPQPIMVGPQQ